MINGVKRAAEPRQNRCVFERSRALALKSPTARVLWEVCGADSRLSVFDVRGRAEDYGWSYSDGQADAPPFHSYRIQSRLHLWLRVPLTFFWWLDRNSDNRGCLSVTTTEKNHLNKPARGLSSVTFNFLMSYFMTIKDTVLSLVSVSAPFSSS